MKTELVSAIQLQEVELQDKAAETQQDGTSSTSSNNNNYNGEWEELQTV